MAEGPERILDVFERGERGRRALLCYLTMPLIEPVHKHIHQNRRQVKTLAQEIDALGYTLDVVHFGSTQPIDYAPYDIMIGLGHPFENSFKQPVRAKRFYYAATPFTPQRNVSELRRIRQLHQRRGVLVSPKRIQKFPDFASALLSDGIISTGNDWVMSTFREVYDGPIHRVFITYLDTFPPEALGRDPAVAASGFLWMGGAGAVLKGLDLCIEAAVQRPQIRLHICGAVETDVLAIYAEELARSPNITVHGAVDVSSETFRSISRDCGFFLYPSGSDAGCGAALTAMYAGMIPLLTRESGVDLADFGVEISGTQQGVLHAIDAAMAMPREDLIVRSRKAHETIAERNSIDAYRRSVQQALGALL